MEEEFVMIKMKALGKRLVTAVAVGLLSVAMGVSAFAATRLDKVSDAYWDDTNITVARWDEVEDATQYEIYLYRNESKVGEAKTKKTYLNLEKKMTTSGEYTFKVRALGKGRSTSNGYWSAESDVTYISEDYAELIKNGGHIDTEHSGPGAKTGGSTTQTSSQAGVVLSAGWQQDANGWWYRNEDGTYPSNGWWQDPSTSIWYYLDEQGYMKTGWINDNEKRYYCDPSSGAMLTGEQTIDGTIFVFDESGVLLAE